MADQSAPGISKREFQLVNNTNFNEVLGTFKSTHPKSAAEKALTKIAREANIGHGQKVTISIADPSKEIVRNYEGFTREVTNPTAFQKQHNITRERVVTYVDKAPHMMPKKGNLYQIVNEGGQSVKIKCTRGVASGVNQTYETTSACRQGGLNINNKQALERTGANQFNILNSDGSVAGVLTGEMHFRGSISK